MAHQIWLWIVAHQLEVYYVLAVLIEQLPPPTATSNAVYRYVYGVIQILAANWRRSKDAVLPPAPPPDGKQ
jgi:hypothetical protein